MVRANITGSHYGFGNWLMQRVTALIMLVIGLLFLGVIAFMASQVNATITSWQQLFNCTAVQISALLFFIALALHAWIGMRDIWMDYVKCYHIRMLLTVLTGIWLIASVLYAIKVIF